MRKVFVLYILTTSPAFAQGFTMIPDGETLYSPQPDDFPVRQQFEPQGGPPVGYIVRAPNVDIYYPYAGGPSYTIPRR